LVIFNNFKEGWIFQPMRLLLLTTTILFCHYGSVFLHQYFSGAKLFAIWYIFGYETIYWASSIYFEFLDQKFPDHPQKLKSSSTSKHTFKDMAFQSLKNQIAQFLVLTCCFHIFEPKEYNHSIFSTFFWFILNYVVFDFVFYVGHYAMHFFPQMKQMHNLHHETFATSAVSCHFMTFPDFFLESLGGGVAIITILLPLGGSPMASISFFLFAILNGIISHSGWDFWFLNDPRTHFVHHAKYKVNLSAGVFDSLFGTKG
jgi:sterol desaturase/sphingolipid hydroxylase (fatty acid hydroxylase superfamily)